MDYVNKGHLSKQVVAIVRYIWHFGAWLSLYMDVDILVMCACSRYKVKERGFTRAKFFNWGDSSSHSDVLST